ncbi:MAG: alpha/beta hydrolase [Synechococcales cyanobacterium CRU_2_2]|nr:alpha/beta hydrolase [Synechococcales cyanobacterium CRU_2_2]
MGPSRPQGIGSLFPCDRSWIAFQVFLTPLRDYFPISDEEKAVLNSAHTQMIRCQLPGYRKAHRIQTYTWDSASPSDPCPTILLLHGWMASSSHMGSFVKPLLKSGFRVVALDAPAHGCSSGVRSDMPAFAHALKTVVDQLGPVDGIIAHSFGAASCLFLLHEEPDSIAIKNLALLAPPSEVSLLLEIITNGLGASPQLRAAMEERFIKRYGHPPSHYTIARMASQNPLPGIVIHDRDDQLVPFREGEAIAQNWPHSQLIASSGLGHGGILRDPDMIAEVIAFQQAHCRPYAPPAWTKTAWAERSFGAVLNQV